MRDAAGEGHWLALLSVDLLDDPAVGSIVLHAWDVTEEVAREEEVEALVSLAGNASVALSNAELYQQVALEKERSDAILASVADGIVAVDRDDRVVLWNAAAEEITGVPREEAVGRSSTLTRGR